MENLDQIKQAIEVEIKHRYIDIHGKKQSFSSFIKKEAEKNYKISKKNPKWAIMIEAFEHYPFSSVPERKRSIEQLIKIIKSEICKSEQIENPITPDNQQNEIAKPARETDVMYVKGVGPKVAYKLNKLGIYTAQDLITYFPRKHIDYSSRTLIKNLKEANDTTVFGYIKSVSAFNTKNNLSVTKVTIADESGAFELNFFQSKSNRYMLERTKAQFPLNAGIMVSGTVKLNNYSHKLTIDKPSYSIMTGEFLQTNNLNLARIVPIYTVCEDLNIKTLRKAIFNAIQLYKNEIINIIPEEIKNRLGLLDKKIAVEQIHFPDNLDILEKARFTLIFEELFLVQLKMLRLRQNTLEKTSAIALNIHNNGIVQQFIKNLPFELTKGQKDAVNEILNDLNSETPMQRLLQGDVGSGKTVVATIMLLAGIENGYQGAFMAPTEILAQQHYNNLVEWLTPYGLSIGLFLGSHGKKLRNQFETSLRNGQMNIAVGTHALIQENIEFNNLGAIVVDEQHRFGVKQRNILKKKSQNPQILTMTATPIPRTLALTVHGDLDLTTINELPKGRLPIKTTLTGSHKNVWDLIRREINYGRQAYIVYPLIDESETLSAKSATIEAEKLQSEIFPDFKIGLLHGKLKNDEKDQVMRDFKEKKYDILVSTTVVEVGVDVPNATVMVIENAERFGLSQLHQLRGRVGRNNLQSYCILVSSSRSQETRERLNIMTETNNGFVIAEKDLQLRGPGEFLGTRQSGLPDLIISDIVRDAKILELARIEAQNFLNENDLKDYPLLKNATSLEIFTGLDI